MRKQDLRDELRWILRHTDADTAKAIEQGYREMEGNLSAMRAVWENARVPSAKTSSRDDAALEFYGTSVDIVEASRPFTPKPLSD